MEEIKNMLDVCNVLRNNVSKNTGSYFDLEEHRLKLKKHLNLLKQVVKNAQNDENENEG